ncbi:MAG: hypothetical protein H9535_20310 [Ignavibacteria bacterium]|nr:hypothetical protein [Ignavibacteria bacterium]
MNLLALFLLCVGALAVLITAPLALFMPYRVIDDTDRPILVYLSVALCFAVPLTMGWCVVTGWNYYQQAAYSTAAQFGIYPTVVLFVGAVVIAVATQRTKAMAKKKESELLSSDKASK